MSGRLVTPRELDNTIIDLNGVDEFRLDQVSNSYYELHLASQRKDKRKLDAEATGLLRKLYGDTANIMVVFEDTLSPERSGKCCVSKPPFAVDIEKYLDKSN